MRFLATLLTALSLPLYAFAAHHGEHLRRHADVAVRARGDLAERGNNYRFTYYDVTVGITSCGGRFSANDFIVALNIAQYDGGSHCGASITITVNGITVTAVVQDECPGCPYGGLDFTEGLFRAFGSLDAGVLYGDWSYNSGSGSGSSPKQDPTTTTPKYTPPPPTSSHYEYTPSSTPHVDYTPPPSSSWSSSSSSSSSTSPTSSSVPTSSPTSTYQPHTSSTPTSSSTSSSYSNAPSGVLAQPAGTINDDGAIENLSSLMDLMIAYGDVVLTAQS